MKRRILTTSAEQVTVAGRRKALSPWKQSLKRKNGNVIIMENNDTF